MTSKLFKHGISLFLILSSVLLFSCGKDDNNSGGGKPDGPEQPDEPVLKTIWDNNSLFFAKLLDNVSVVDTLFDNVNTAKFDRNGYLTAFNVKGYDAQNNPVEQKFQCAYTADSLLSSISSDDMTLTLYYGSHGKYVEVEQDFFNGNEIKYLYVFQPKFLKNLTSITVNGTNGRMKFEFSVSGGKLTVKDPDGNVWSETTYGDSPFPAERITRFSGTEYKKDENGNYIKVDGKYVTIKFTAVSTETFGFNAENGKLTGYTDKVVKTYEDKTTSTTESSTTYNDDKYNTVARQGKEEFTYDSYGDYTHIGGGEVTSDFTYTRDAHGNWYDRTETSVIFGETYSFRDKRTISYY